MKKIVLLFLIALMITNCENNLELNKYEIENLIFNSKANELIKFEKPIITEEYEDWRNLKFNEIEDDSTKRVQPYIKLKFGKDSVRMSLLPLREWKELAKAEEDYTVELTLVNNNKIIFFPSDFFPDENTEYKITDIEQVIEKRYNYSDSLNQKCPEWWIMGNEREDLIDKEIFKEMVNGYIRFTKKSYLKRSSGQSKEIFLKEHKRKFPFRLSFEEPMCRYGG